MLSLSLVISPAVIAESRLADGSYDIDYVVLQADSDSVSIANDYFLKKADYFLRGDKSHVELEIKNSKWVTSLQVVEGDKVEDVTVVAENLESDIRKVAFPVPADLSDPIFMKMHVQIAELNYDHKYTVRFQFDPASVEPTDKEPLFVVEQAGSGSSSKSTSMVLYIGIGLIVLAVLIWIVVRRKRK